MNYYFCDACHYCFEYSTLPDRCPDCGKTQWHEKPAVRPATEKEIADLVGKDIIVVAETMIMYATVVRVEKQEDGSFLAGVSAKKFTDEVLQYLFDHIG